jgi:hypothetical protein
MEEETLPMTPGSNPIDPRRPGVGRPTPPKRTTMKRANRQRQIESLSVQAECLAGHEAGLQRVIVQALRLLGFTVLQTSRHRKRCWRCGTWPAGGDGADRGLPDLLIWSPTRGAWIGVELKRTGGRLSPEQAALARRGMIHVARTLEEALLAVGAADPAGGRQEGERS